MFELENSLFKVGELICLADGEWEDYHEYNHAIVLKDFDGKKKPENILTRRLSGNIRSEAVISLIGSKKRD